MDNQHKIIKGYRDLSQEEIDLINEIKEEANRVGELVEKVMCLGASDLSWAGDANMSLRKGFMSLVRAVAKPESF